MNGAALNPNAQLAIAVQRFTTKSPLWIEKKVSGGSELEETGGVPGHAQRIPHMCRGGAL